MRLLPHPSTPGWRVNGRKKKRKEQKKAKKSVLSHSIS